MMVQNHHHDRTLRWINGNLRGYEAHHCPSITPLISGGVFHSWGILGGWDYHLVSGEDHPHVQAMEFGQLIWKGNKPS